MLEKVKAKAKEIVSNDRIRSTIELCCGVSIGLIGVYYVGYAYGFGSGVDHTGKAMVNVFEELAKIAEKAA